MYFVYLLDPHCALWYQFALAVFILYKSDFDSTWKTCANNVSVTCVIITLVNDFATGLSYWLLAALDVGGSVFTCAFSQIY